MREKAAEMVSKIPNRARVLQVRNISCDPGHRASSSRGRIGAQRRRKIDTHASILQV